MHKKLSPKLEEIGDYTEEEEENANAQRGNGEGSEEGESSFSSVEQSLYRRHDTYNPIRNCFKYSEYSFNNAHRERSFLKIIGVKRFTLHLYYTRYLSV